MRKILENKMNEEIKSQKNQQAKKLGEIKKMKIKNLLFGWYIAKKERLEKRKKLQAEYARLGILTAWNGEPLSPTEARWVRMGGRAPTVPMPRRPENIGKKYNGQKPRKI